MKKFLFVSMIFFCIFSYGQNAFYDAVKIAKDLPPINNNKVSLPDDNSIWTILRNYVPDADSIKTKIADDFKDNPFVSVETPAGEVAQKSSLLSSLGSTDVTSAADGLVQFLIKRAKEEMLISFFQNLKTDKKLPEFNILFPNTKILLDNFNSWEYANIINTLREAFEKDLKQLMGNIPNLNTLNGSDSNYSKAVQNRIKAIQDFFRTEAGRLFLSALQVGNGFINQQKIPDIINTISGDNYLTGIKSLSPAEVNIIKLINILSLSIRSTDFGKSYVNTTDMNALFANDTETKIFFGLLYQQIKSNGITINGKDVTTILSTGNVANVRTSIINIISNSDKLVDAYTKLSEEKKIAGTDLTPYWAAIFENAKSFFQSLDVKDIDPSFQLPAQFQTVIGYATATLTIANDIAVKNYNAAIVSTLGFLTQTMKVDDASGSAFKSFLVKYGSFAANMVQAKNSDDAESAIEAVALPAGSASIKKQSSFNIALNAYLGGFYGNEYLGAKTNSKWAPITGVYAPVGITISKGNFPFKGGSLSLLLNVIDLGAIASYRLQDASTAKLPEVTLQNILAPGFGFIYGIPGLPISFGWSKQWGPALRNINAQTIQTSQPNKRWQLFLAVDIPLLNFHTKSNPNYQLKN